LHERDLGRGLAGGDAPMRATRFGFAGPSTLAALALSLAACGGGSSSTSTGSATTVAGAFQVAPPGTTGRVVVIKTLDTLRFDPSSVTVHRGETVTFRVENVAKIDHEFDVGDAAFQAQHEQEMRQMPADMQMGDEPSGFALKPGETKELTLTFTQPGTLIYGCHEAGHYAAGMKGEIKIT
jgi:uncharacterized cupredoxin-like copper-binding protein